MNQSKIKVLYIGGWGHSGSTILARILGQIDGFFHSGELRTVWLDGLKPSGICGCGVPLKQCSIWSSVFEKAFGGIEQIDREEMTRLRRRSEPKSQEVLQAILMPQIRSSIVSRLEKYVDVLEKLYRSIKDVTNCKVIVDDSLHPGYAYTLAQMSAIDLYIVHIIRDPRGSAYSWWKRRKTGLGQYTIRGSALGWSLRNIVTEMLGGNFPNNRYLQVFYEDLTARPRDTIESITNLIELKDCHLPFVSSDQVELGITHSVFGNPNRSKTGVVKVQQDDEWKRKLERSHYIKVMALIWPLMLKYGYFTHRN